jgi:small multidrug resistance family-3 protein
MLFTLAMVKTRRNATAVNSGRSGADDVCLVADAASSSKRAVYAAYGGVYVCTALLWLRFVDGVKLSHYDWAGALIALCGMLIIVAGWGRA